MLAHAWSTSVIFMISPRQTQQLISVPNVANGPVLSAGKVAGAVRDQGLLSLSIPAIASS
jgi:hypothetical protein